MDATRFLIVMADDYGVGPETSRGILELAARGVVTGTVLMVNSPYALDAVRAWRQSGIGAGTGLAPLPDDGSPGRGSGARAESGRSRWVHVAAGKIPEKADDRTHPSRRY